MFGDTSAPIPALAALRQVFPDAANAAADFEDDVVQQELTRAGRWSRQLASSSVPLTCIFALESDSERDVQTPLGETEAANLF